MGKFYFLRRHRRMEKYFRPVHPHKDSKSHKVSQLEDEGRLRKDHKQRNILYPRPHTKIEHHQHQGHCHPRQQAHQPSGDNGIRSTAEDSGFHHHHHDNHHLHQHDSEKTDHSHSHPHHHAKQKHRHTAAGIAHSSTSGTSYSSSTASSSSSSSSSTSSSSSSSSTSSPSSSSDLSSRGSNESLNKRSLGKPKHSRSCSEISRGRRGVFEDEDDRQLLMDGGGHRTKASAKEKQGRSASSHRSPPRSVVKKKARTTRISGREGSFRKAKSMEVLSSREHGGREENDDAELERRKIEVRENTVKEKEKFSAFLNEITRQVLSPLRLTSLGVTDARRPLSPVHGSVTPSKADSRLGVPRQRRSRAASADSIHSSHASVNSQFGDPSHSSKRSCHSKSGKYHRHGHHHSTGDARHHMHHSRTSYTDSPKNSHFKRHHSWSSLDRPHSPSHQHQPRGSKHQRHQDQCETSRQRNHGHQYSSNHEGRDHHSPSYRRDDHGSEQSSTHHHHHGDHHNPPDCQDCVNPICPDLPRPLHRDNPSHQGCSHNFSQHCGDHLSSSHQHHHSDNRNKTHPFDHNDKHCALHPIGIQSRNHDQGDNQNTILHHQPHHHGDHHGQSHQHHHGDHHSPTSHHHRQDHHSPTHHHGEHQSPTHHHHHGDSPSPTSHHHHGDPHSPSPHHHHEDHHSQKSIHEAQSKISDPEFENGGNSDVYQHSAHSDKHLQQPHIPPTDSHLRCSDFEHITTHHGHHNSDQEHHPTHGKMHHHSQHAEMHLFQLSDHHNHSKRHSPVSLPADRTLESHSKSDSSRNTSTNASSPDEDQSSCRSSIPSLPKDTAQDRTKMTLLQEQNPIDSLLGEELMSSQQLLEAELHRTRVELAQLTDQFKRLQDNYSSTQQTNNLLEKKLHSVAQNMEGERESLNQRIAALTKQLATTTPDTRMEMLHETSALHGGLEHHFQSDDSTDRCVLPTASQFMDSHNYAKTQGQNQSLRSVPEEEESDWSEMGDETSRFIPTGSNRARAKAAGFLPWRQEDKCWAEQGDGDVDSQSGGEENIWQHPPGPLQIPHLRFTVHRETSPVPALSDGCPAAFEVASEGGAAEGGYRVPAGHRLGSPIPRRSVSLEEIPAGCQPMQEELRGTEAMMDLHRPEEVSVAEDSDDEIVHRWRTRKESEVTAGDLQAPSQGLETDSSLDSLQSAQRMLNHIICELQPSGERDGRDGAEAKGWAGGLPEELWKGERTEL